MKKIFYIIFSLGLITLSACDYLAKDISEDMNFTVNGDLFKNTVQIEVVDAATGQAIPSLKGIYIEGPNSEVIYSQTGKKNPEYTNGIISLGVDPKFLFTDDNPVEFNVAINAVGYLPTMKTIIVLPNDFNQQIKIEMVNPLTGGNSLEITQTEIPLNNGKVISNGLIKKTGAGPDTVYYDDNFSTLGLPVGTGFYYWEDNKTGEIASALSSWEDEIIQFESNGQTRYSKLGMFLDTNKIKEDLVERSYTGSKIRAVIYYPTEDLSDIKIINYTYLGRNRKKKWKKNRDYVYVETLTEDSYREDNFRSAVLKPILKVEFFGEGPDGKEFQVYPDGNSVFYSMRLNPNFINPITNTNIKEGDLIEFEDQLVFVELRQYGGEEYEVLNSPIVKDKNGHLRAQGKSPNAGYYVYPEHKENVYFSFNNFRNSEIPDIENLSINAYLIIDGLKIPYNPYSLGFNNMQLLDFEFASQNKIDEVYMEFTIKYFNKEILKDYRLNDNGEFDPTERINFDNINSLSKYEISLFCKNGTKVNPSIFTRVFVPSENTYYYANIKNGKWATRGIELGKELKLDFTYDNIIIDTAVVIEKDNIINKVVNNSQFCQ